MASLYTIAKAQRPLSAPHGVPVHPLFFAHNPGLRDYKDASKIKTLEVHPVLPWVVTADEDGILTIWDYQSESIVLSFAADAIKEGQRSAIAAIEAQAAFAAAHDVAVPDVAGPGIGSGPSAEPGATNGSATETFISSVVGGVSKKRVATTGLSEDARKGRTGAVRSVKFADEHVLSWYCGQGTGDYEHSDVHGNVGCVEKGALPAFCSSMDDVCTAGSYCASIAVGALHGGNGQASAHGRKGSLVGRSVIEVQAAPRGQNWLLILCEHRVLLLDYSTRAVVDVPHNALLIEASGPGGLQRTTTRGKPAVHSAALIGPGVIAFGCEDGVIRIWAADSNAVIQTLRHGQASAKPITHLHVANTCPYALPGTTQALSPISPLASVHKDARTLLIAGGADGVVSVYEVMGGRMVLDSGSVGGSGPGGSGPNDARAQAGAAAAALAMGGGNQRLKLPGELSDLTVGAITMHAVALGSDKSVTVWDCASRPAQPGAAPRVAQSRISTSSAAAEGGVGSKLMAAVTMGSHPALPPSTLLVAGKGPHLELAIAGSAEKGPGAEAGIIFYDLRTARPGLPNKLKIYTLSRHPFRPEIVAAGTNIGVFVLAIAPQYAVAAASVTHPAWRIPPALTDELSPEGHRVAEGQVALYVNVQGMLVASEVSVTTPAHEEDEAARVTTACPLPRGPGGLLPRLSGKAAASAPMGLDISSIDHVLLPVLNPAMPPPSTMVPASKENPTPAHNALAQLLAILKGSPMGGTKGVRLRVSGSGRYIAAVWPEHKYHAIYKVHVPVGLHAVAHADAHAPGGEAEQPRDDEHHSAHAHDGWSCEYVDGGPAVDVAWSGPTVGGYEDQYGLARPLHAPKAGKGKEGAAAEETGMEAQPSGPIVTRWDRYVVLEPGQIMSGRGPMGGGMAIGSAPAGAGKGGKGEKGGKGGDDAAGTGSKGGKEAKVGITPATLSLRQVPVLDDPHMDPGKVMLISQDLAFPQGMEPTGVCGSGPLLAVALAPELSHVSYNPQQALNQSTLSFYSWTCLDPVVAEEEKKAAESRYSGASKAKGARHRLVPAGGGSGMPCPSLQALATGHAVLWNAEATRVALLTPFNTHILAHFSPRRLAASVAAKGKSSSAANASAVQNGTLVELCRVPVPAICAVWHGTALCVSTTDARLALICPPTIDPHIVAEIAAAGSSASASSLGLSGTVGSLTVVNGARLQPLVVDLQALQCSSALTSGSMAAMPFPSPSRGLAHVSACAPLFFARGYVVTLHWTGSRGSAAGAYGPPMTAGAGNGGVQITAVPCAHPGLRAVMAASWAGGSDYRSSTGSYIQSCRWASSWATRLPSGTALPLAKAIADVGCLAAALMIPGLPPAAGISLALSKKQDVYVRAHSRVGGQGWSAVDLRVSVAYLLELLHSSSELDLRMLAGPADIFGPQPHDVLGAAHVESDANAVGVWGQVGSYLSMVAASIEDRASAHTRDEVLDPVRIRHALVTFVHRLSRAGLTSDAFMVAASLHRSGASITELQQEVVVKAHTGGKEGGQGTGEGAGQGEGTLEGLPVTAAELMLQVLLDGGVQHSDVAAAALLSAR